MDAGVKHQPPATHQDLAGPQGFQLLRMRPRDEDQLRRQRVFFIGLPLPIRGADSCPIRALAIEEE